jgi:uncharacterized membrane protein
MGEASLILLSLALLLAIPTSLVLAVVAWRRSRRLEELEQRVFLLERAGRTSAAPVETPRAPSATVAPAPIPLRAPERPPEAPREPVRAPAPVATAPVAPVPRPIPASFPAAPAPAPRARIDWERFLGVRGAAVVGGLVLALAGLLFVQHSIQQGWITPQLRVWMAGGFGLAAVALSERLWRRDYRHAGNALAGAGGVLVFGGLWAGYRLYGMFPFAVAFPFMALVSVGLAALALRRPSKVVAVFGLLGGFATPLLVTLGADHPLGLFGYLLALDVGLFALARRRGWGLLGVLGSLGSMAVFAVYLGFHFDAGVTPWALGFVAASSAALCLPALTARGAGERPPLAGAAVALAGSFPLALTVAARASFELGLLPLSAVSAVLLALSGVVARRGNFPALAAGGALGVLALVLSWSLATPLTVEGAWHLLAATALLSLVAHALVELDARARRSVEVGAAAVIELGLAGVAVAALARTGQAHPLAALGYALLPALLLLRQAWLGASTVLAASAALPAGALALCIAITRGAALARPLDARFSVALVGVPALFALHALLVRPRERSAGSWLATSIAALFGLCALWLRAHALRGAPLEFHAAAFGLLCIAGHAAGRRGSTVLMVAPTLLGALLAMHWSNVSLALESAPLAGLALAAAAPLGLALGPRASERAHWGPWVAAALAPLVWQPALLRLAFDNASRSVHVAVPLSGAAIAAFLALRARGLPLELTARRHALAAAAAAGSILVALAPAFALERGHFSTPFLAGFLIVCAWRALTHRALAVTATALFGLGLPGSLIETVRTLETLQPWERSGLPLLHWMSALWLLPALLAVAAATVFARTSARIPAAICGVVALLAGFVSLNLEVQDLFNEGPAFEVATARLPLRDFLTSCAWALYAFGLLVAGLRRRGGALRKASLAFLLAAVAKVFLHDLGTLTGLYRVGSLVGLALALFAVSLCYQRFVFRREAADSSPAPSVQA